MRRLEPAVKTVWAIRIGITVSLILVGVLVYDLAILGLRGDRFPPIGAMTLGTLIAGVLMAVIIPRLRYRFWRFALREEELLLERGIWNRVRTVVPLRRIQHLDVSQTVFEREFNLGRLIVHTAGTRSNAVELPGLAIEEAERLRDTIKQYVLEDTL
ncbi:PH domain-containing protein [soil metagenome]